MATKQPTTETASPYDDSIPFHSGITGYADVVISTSVRFESVELMHAFCEWVAANSDGSDAVVRDFLTAAENARDEALRIRNSWSGER